MTSQMTTEMEAAIDEFVENLSNTLASALKPALRKLVLEVVIKPNLAQDQAITANEQVDANQTDAIIENATAIDMNDALTDEALVAAEDNEDRITALEDEVQGHHGVNAGGGGNGAAGSVMVLHEIPASALSVRHDVGSWEDSSPTTGPNGGVVANATLRGAGRKDGAREALGYEYDIPGVPVVAESGIFVVVNRLTSLQGADHANAITYTGVPSAFGYAGMRHLQNNEHLVGHDRNRLTSTIPARNDANRITSIVVVGGTAVAAGAGTWTGQQGTTQGDGDATLTVSGSNGFDFTPGAKSDLKGLFSLAWTSSHGGADFPIDWGEKKIEAGSIKLNLDDAIPLTLADLQSGGVADSDPESGGSTISFDADTGIFTMTAGTAGSGLFSTPDGLVRWLINLPEGRRDDGTQGVYVLIEPLGTEGNPSSRTDGGVGVGVAGDGGLGNGYLDSTGVVSWASFTVFDSLGIFKHFGYTWGSTSGRDNDNGNFVNVKALVRLGTTGKFESASQVGEGGIVANLAMGLDANNDLVQSVSGAGASARGIDLAGPGKAFICSSVNVPTGSTVKFKMSVLYVDELPADMAIE